MIKLLLIDDEPDILRVLAMSLRADGYDVVTADSGEAGLAAFSEHAPDIVLVDIKMPGLDGIEVLQAVKSQDVLSEVIIITGHGDVDNAVEALKHGASDFINKPVRDEALAIALKRACEKLTIRRDTFSNIDIDGWHYTSQPERTEAEVKTVLDVSGDLVRRTITTGDADNIIVEPITLDRLRRIWKDKGLLME